MRKHTIFKKAVALAAAAATAVACIPAGAYTAQDAQPSLSVTDETEDPASATKSVRIQAEAAEDADAGIRLYFWDYGEELPEDMDEWAGLLTEPSSSFAVEGYDEETGLELDITLADGTEDTVTAYLYAEEESKVESGEGSETGSEEESPAVSLAFTLPAGASIDAAATITVEDAVTVTYALDGGDEFLGGFLLSAAEETAEEPVEESDTEAPEAPDTEETDTSYAVEEEDKYNTATSETEESRFSLFSSIRLMGEEEYLWSVDNYYLNEDSLYDVEETDDFSLKYQVEFHASENYSAGQVEIRIPATLLTLRDGTAVTPSDIGVPNGTAENYQESSSTPFNWYLDENTGELVFWNYRAISSGTNTTFQVLYKIPDIMQVYDGTTWSITPHITVTKDDGSTEEMDGNTMTGTVDTGVTLSSVTKKAYYAAGKSYTPGLFTESQVLSYISASTLPEQYAGDNFDNYVYVLWQVSITGSATQPWTLDVGEALAVNGESVEANIVGYSSITSSSTTSRSLNQSFYVVAAYPADSVVEGDTLGNTVTITANPVDGDPSQTKSSSAEYSYEEYKWTYTRTPGVDPVWMKKSASSSKYSAYLDIYEANQSQEKDTGSFTFTTVTTGESFGHTHNTLGAEQEGEGAGTSLGEYIDGTYFTITTVDDAVYAYPNAVADNGVMLTGDDYYFSSITVTQSEYGYDVYEDEKITAETIDGLDQGTYIYAMFAGSDEWEQVDCVAWDGTGKLTYTFSSADIKKEPYRVKVVHNTTSYQYTCTVKVSVTLKYDSPTILKLQEEYGEDLSTLQLENVSGVSGEYYTSEGLQGYNHSQPEDGTYSESGLSDFTEGLYGILLQRDNAYSTLTRLEKHAASYKTNTSYNDPDNARVVVNYSLTAYEGYYVPDQSTVTTLKSQGASIPDRTEVEYYDLLPYGMKFDASAGVTAGRITNISSSSWTSNSRVWNTSGVTVTVGDEDVIQNWNGTGRTMVVFHISYSGDDPDVYSNGMWLVGYGISFSAYYDWSDIDTCQSEYNIAAYMPVSSDTTPLYGTEAEVYCDDGTIPDDSYSAFSVGDINGDNETGIRNVLYAKSLSQVEVATSTESNLVKKVKADDDTFSSYSDTTSVGEGRGYTYQVTVTNTTSGTLSNIVVYDCLEDALYRADVQGEEVFVDTSGSWTGTYTGIVTTELENAGASPVVYYNASRGASITQDSQAPDEILTSEYGWYTAEEWEALGYSLSDVQAVAVDIRTSSDDGSFTLAPGESVSFTVNMTAPDSEQDYTYAYNNSSFYSVTISTTGNETAATVTGNSTRVELAESGTVEVEKEFANAEDVPDSMSDYEFTYTIMRGGTPLANQKYLLYKYTDGEWVQDSVVRSADANGQFTLAAGQKAVFPYIADYEDVTVEEAADVFWSYETEQSVSGTTVSYLFNNTYRPPVYLYKTASVSDNLEDSSNETFTFQVYTVTDGVETLYANGEYVYVSEALTDGSSPEVLGTGVTDGDGCVTLKLGEIIAFYPGDAGTQFKVVEVSTGTDSWICNNDTVSGTVTESGTSATITNIYKYRNLILTKEITDQDAEDCASEFTFKVTDSAGNAVTGNRWVVIDADGNEVTDENGDVIEGVLSDDGTVTLTGAGSSCRLKIEGLAAGETYTVTEVDYDGTLYTAVDGGTVDASMPMYVSYRTASITNKYLLRDLSVSKLAVTGDEDLAAESQTREFTFTLYKQDGEDLTVVSGAAYTIEGSGYTLSGDEYVTGTDGTFTLKSNETAVFDDIGYEGDVFVVKETADDDFTQIYPDGDGQATMTDDGAEVSFINGDSGMVAVTKSVIGTDDEGKAVADMIRSDNTTEVLSTGAYTVDIDINVYDENGDAATGEYSLIYITQAGDVSIESFTGSTTASLYAFDNIYLSGIPEGYTVEVSEDEGWKIALLSLSADAEETAGIDAILSHADSLKESSIVKGDASKVTLTNYLSSGNNASEIYKIMSDASDDVNTGAEITFRVEVYDGSNWNSASGIRYITMDENGPTSTILTTGSDGLITLTKTDNGYPHIRFVDNIVYANIYENMKEGDLRIIEVSADESWGILSGYDSGNYLGGSAVYMPEADTFVNANDISQVITVSKDVDGEEDEDYSNSTFTFKLIHVLSASELPITSSDQVLASEAGAGIYYVVYDSETGLLVSDGYTDKNGQFTLNAGQYAKLYVPDDTVWMIYEQISSGWELENIVADKSASVLEDENIVTVQDDKTVYRRVEISEAAISGYSNQAYTGSEITFGDYLVLEYNGETLEEGIDYTITYSNNTNVGTATITITGIGDFMGTTTVTFEIKTNLMKYAVAIYGIEEDIYYDEDEAEQNAGLTFGPATGKSYLNTYYAHVKEDSEGVVNSDNFIARTSEEAKEAGVTYCVHWLTWEQIIEQSKTDPTVFEDCLKKGCTHSVEVILNDSLMASGYTIPLTTGDGVSVLYNSINSSYRKWNNSNSNSGGWPQSRIRATLNGIDTDSTDDGYITGSVADTTTCLTVEESLFSCFPEELQGGIVEKSVDSNTKYNSTDQSYVATTYDNLWLFSYKEYFNYTSTYNLQYEGTQYTRMTKYATSSTLRKGYDESVSSGAFWLRSPSTVSSVRVYYVNTGGSFSIYGASYTINGLAPGFCLK